VGRDTGAAGMVVVGMVAARMVAAHIVADSLQDNIVHLGLGYMGYMEFQWAVEGKRNWVVGIVGHLGSLGED